MTKAVQDQLQDRCNAIEESYEFMLAYAAQGLAGDSSSKSGGQLRDYLQRSNEAMTGLGDVFRKLVADSAVEPGDCY